MLTQKNKNESLHLSKPLKAYFQSAVKCVLRNLVNKLRTGTHECSSIIQMRQILCQNSVGFDSFHGMQTHLFPLGIFCRSAAETEQNKTKCSSPDWNINRRDVQRGTVFRCYHERGARVIQCGMSHSVAADTCACGQCETNQKKHFVFLTSCSLAAYDLCCVCVSVCVSARVCFLFTISPVLLIQGWL